MTIIIIPSMIYPSNLNPCWQQGLCRHCRKTLPGKAKLRDLIWPDLPSAEWVLSMDWFKGKFYRKTPDLMGKSMVSCRFSLKPIHWFYWFPMISTQSLGDMHKKISTTLSIDPDLVTKQWKRLIIRLESVWKWDYDHPTWEMINHDIFFRQTHVIMWHYDEQKWLR